LFIFPRGFHTQTITWAYSDNIFFYKNSANFAVRQPTDSLPFPPYYEIQKLSRDHGNVSDEEC